MSDKRFNFTRSLCILCVTCLGVPTSWFEETLTIPKPARNSIQREELLRYISSLGVANKGGILTGQWVSSPSSWPEAYNLFAEKLAQKTGKNVALLGSDYFNGRDRSIEEIKRLDPILVRQWELGGLITLTWSADNPWYSKKPSPFCHDVPNPCVPGDLSDLTRPETVVGARYKAEMDILADRFQALAEAGVIVLFRPFHEMNGNWFWWGVQSAKLPSHSNFVKLWVYTHEYFTRIRNLKNILWTFSPCNSEKSLTFYPSWNGIIQTATFYYPGSQYTDIVGLDVYVDHLANPAEAGAKSLETSLPTYPEMIALGKPFGLTELGPSNPTTGKFDFDTTLHEIASYYTRTAYFMAWQDNPAAKKYFAIVSNKDPAQVMNDPLLITREEINLK